MTDMAFDPTIAADLLIAARQEGARPAGLQPSPATTGEAYAVQDAVLKGLGDAGGAWKMALLGGVEREAAVLPQAALYPSGTVLDLPPHAAIEVETAVILSGDPGQGDPADAIAEIRLAFELVATRFAAEVQPQPLDKMADAFSSAGIVLGTPMEGWRAGLPDRLGIALVVDGAPVEAAEAAAPLAEALDFLVWLSGHARLQGRPLKRGDVVITGARIGPLPLNGATKARATAMGATVEIG